MSPKITYTHCNSNYFKTPPTDKTDKAMRILSLILATSISLLLSACTSMQITAQPGQNVVFNRGNHAVISSKKAGLVAIEGLGAAPQNNRRATFCITYINKTKSPVNVGLENISATNAKGQKIRLYSAEDLRNEARRQAAALAFAAGMNAGMQSYAAAQPSYTTYSGGYYGGANYNAYNSYGNHIGSLQGTQSGNFYGSASTYNPAQAAIANQAIQQNTAMQIGGIQNQLSASLARATDIFSLTTVPPGAQISGIIVAKKSSITNFTVKVNDESYSANFAIK